MPRQVDFYVKDDGTAPIEELLDELPNKWQVKVLAAIDNLKEAGVDLPFPFSSQVRGRLRELRTRFGKTRLRVFYFGDPRRVFILLHGIVKATEQLPESDIRIAEQRMAAHIQRLQRR